MKPTAKQIAVMELVRTHLSALTRANDITSPTVISDFDEDLWDFDFKKNHNDRLSDAFNDLINIIRDIK